MSRLAGELEPEPELATLAPGSDASALLCALRERAARVDFDAQAPAPSPLEELGKDTQDEDEDEEGQDEEEDKFEDEYDATETGTETEDEDEEERRLQEEWDVSVAQFKALVSTMLLPYLGKAYGRKFGYWGFTRWQLHGLTPAFFGLGSFFPANSWVPSWLIALFEP